MMNREGFNKLIGIKENYEMPGRLKSVLLSDDKNKFLGKFCELFNIEDVSKLFQDNYGEREKFKQEFTPLCVCELVNELVGSVDSCADICAGIGGLSHKTDCKELYAEELSGAAFPVLLMFACIKNIPATIVNRDCITGNVFESYKIVPGQRFGDITREKTNEKKLFDVVVMNPPYSQKFKKGLEDDPRFANYGTPPSSFADFAFIMHGISMLKDGGRLFAIVPHGVLFRSGKERIIRKKMLERNEIKTIIGLPCGMFQNTSIPVCILEIEKNRTDGSVLFVEGSQLFAKVGRMNEMKADHIKKIADVCRTREDVPKFSHVAAVEEIEANDYNLNISRYVDTYEPEPIPDIVDALEELKKIEEETEKAKADFVRSIGDMYGTDERRRRELERIKKIVGA